MKLCQISFTTDSLKNGEEITETLLTRHWIACAQRLGPIQSRYHWQGKIESAQEWKFILKTPLHGKTAVTEFIQKHHTYETPEILAEEIESVNPDFSQWILDECRNVPEN